MKVYAVWSGEYEGRDVEAVFDSRDLAEAYIGSADRPEYDRLVALAGQPIPRQGTVMTEKDEGGLVTRRWIEPQRHPHPGEWDEWRRGRGERWIEEYDVLEELPPPE